jgi:CheY-like chemotaxis protein
MTPHARGAAGAKARILVAGDNSSDAAQVQRLVEAEFDHVFVSTDPDKVVEDFTRHAPDVLLLAFDQLQKAEQYYLGLYRMSGSIHLVPHRTVVLCGKGEVMQAYLACKRAYFDDYVLFWPVTHDAPRLLMSVHHALRGLATARDGGPTVAQFAARARQLSGLGEMLDQQITAAVQVPDAQWADTFRKECEPHVQSVRDLNALADSIVPLILVVDDDEFQRKLVARLLEDSPYRLAFADGGVEALNLLRKNSPDLILMDVMMPGLDGIETTRRLRALPQFAHVPVIMVTGKTQGTTVRDSVQAGATDYLVKPFDKPTLLAKVGKALRVGSAVP